jgi:hypothetical protein
MLTFTPTRKNPMPHQQQNFSPLPVRKKSPRLILGLGQADMASQVDAQFRGIGWDVIRLTPTDAAKLAHRQKASAIVLSLDNLPESGLLMCAKIRLIHPQARIVIIGPESAKLTKFARLAGAAGYLPDRVTAPAITKAVLGN